MSFTFKGDEIWSSNPAFLHYYTNELVNSLEVKATI
jgi:hypothetical protein